MLFQFNANKLLFILKDLKLVHEKNKYINLLYNFLVTMYILYIIYFI